MVLSMFNHWLTFWSVVAFLTMDEKQEKLIKNVFSLKRFLKIVFFCSLNHDKSIGNGFERLEILHLEKALQR